MRSFFIFVFLILSLKGAVAAKWEPFPAKSSVTTDLLAAPRSPEILATIPKGSVVTIGLCFDAGNYCTTQWRGLSGYVISTDFVAQDGIGKNVKARYTAFWESLQGAPSKLYAADKRTIYAFGDDLTVGLGATSPEKTYPAVAAAKLGRTVINAGVSSQTSTEIASRMGAISVDFQLQGSMIPGAGMVVVKRRNVSPITIHNPSMMAGSIRGVWGHLIRNSDGSYAFLRGYAGDPVPCPRFCSMKLDDSQLSQGYVTWIWAGRNGPTPSFSVEEDIDFMVKHVGHDRYLVGSILYADTDPPDVIAWIKRVNNAMKTKYGDHFVDIRQVLVAAASSSPADLENVTRGVTPKSLRSDVLHLNDAGYAIVGNAFADATIAHGW